MNRKNRNKKGVIGLTTLLLLSSILVVSGIALVLTSIDLGESSINNFRLSVARTTLQSCFEEGMIRISRNKNYTGVVNINLNGSSCEAQISDSGVNQKRIDISSTNIDNEFAQSFLVDTSTDPISIIE